MRTLYKVRDQFDDLLINHYLFKLLKLLVLPFEMNWSFHFIREITLFVVLFFQHEMDCLGGVNGQVLINSSTIQLNLNSWIQFAAQLSKFS